MNPLILEPKVKDTINIVQEAKKELKYVGSLILKRGHTLFKYNEQTGDVLPAIVKHEVLVNTKGQAVKFKKVYFEENCIYVGALNAKNARKKIDNAIKLLNYGK